MIQKSPSETKCALTDQQRAAKRSAGQASGIQVQEKGGVCRDLFCSMKPNDPRGKPVGFFESGMA